MPSPTPLNSISTITCNKKKEKGRSSERSFAVYMPDLAVGREGADFSELPAMIMAETNQEVLYDGYQDG